MDHLSRFGQLLMPVESELGRCTMPVSQILALGPGSVIRLNQPVGTAVELFIGGAPFGRGDLVQSGKSMAVRITAFRETRNNGNV
jgi:flagellar motor switch/type III secretory pathway protein FliN